MSTPSTTNSATTAASASDLARARTFDLSKVDPCTLLTAAQLVSLQANLAPDASGTPGTDPTCNFTSSTGTSYAVFLNLTANASDTVGAIQEKISQTVVIEGFDTPLVSVPNQGCSAFVNTGDSEYLSVQANGRGRVPDDQLCELVQPATKMVLDNLVALQP